MAAVIEQSDAVAGKPVVHPWPNGVRLPTLLDRGLNAEAEQGRKEPPRAKEVAKEAKKEKREPKKKRERDGPLTNEEFAYARELADELRPLLKRMPPEKQRAILGRLGASDLNLMS